MELRHLRYFVAVAETRHFGLAAKRLHMAQPAVSHAIRQLENELDVALFHRTTRQVALTDAGHFLQEEAQRILAAVDDSINGARQVVQGRRGLVRIGFTGTAAFSFLPKVARVLNEQLPAVALDVHADLLNPALFDGLESGQLDLGVLRPPVTGDRLALRTVAHENLLLALPAEHRLVAEPTVGMADLRTEQWVMYADSHSAMNHTVERSCRTAGFVPNVVQEAPSTTVLLALVSAGLGVALVPQGVRSASLHGVVFRELYDADVIELALAWRREDSSPVVATVLQTMESAGLFDQADASAEVVT